MLSEIPKLTKDTINLRAKTNKINDIIQNCGLNYNIFYLHYFQ